MNSPLKLKIELKNLPHKCTRTVLVPENINMRQLHFIIQDAVDWHNAHLFEFTDAKVRQTISIGMPDDFEMEWIGPPKKDAHKVNLKNTFLKKRGKSLLVLVRFWRRLVAPNFFSQNYPKRQGPF